MAIVVCAVAAALLFEGWTTHEIAAAQTRRDCTTPIPDAADNGSPVLRITGQTVETARMPAGTVALTYDAGPDPVWTPRLLDLLREHRAHATFFVSGAQAARRPDLVRRIRAEGHEIGSYTYTGADLGSVSARRVGLELSLTQTVLAGAAGVDTRLLRLPHTTRPETLCGGEWTAARRAAADGYLLIAADPPSRKPEQGAVLQYGHTQSAYQATKKLLDSARAKQFTTVTAGLSRPSANTPVSFIDRQKGKGLIWAQSIGHTFVSGMTWVLWIAGALAALRLALLVVLARVHVRRMDRFVPGTPRLREVNGPVTVLVPAYNEEAGIESTVRSLLASTHRQLQIVVIDDGSTDRTAEIAERIRDPRVTVVRQANAGKAAALNTGLAHTRYDYVVMVDADTVFEPDAIHRLIQPLAHPAVGAVSGNTKVGNRRGLLGRWQHLEYVFGFNLDRRMFEVLECMPTVPGAIGAFRRDALMGVGGVSEDTLAEDTDLTMALWRAGWR
ncbi:glycosyltransferase, partial [Streptomyces sp. MZ04]|uniref:glycosyltransferase n=1 Tax=Streptomyces sp. MZ04 TaxID=2559236 RepID=UPI00107E69B0